MKNYKRIIAMLICIISLIGSVTIPASAMPQNPWEDVPVNSGDYAYWNGSRMVKSNSTTKDEI